MKIEGKFIKTLQRVEGETERGPWVRGGFVIETFGEYPKKMAFTTFGEDKVKMADGLTEGQPVEVYFNPESREWGDKWFTDLKASSVKPMATATYNAQNVHQAAAPQPQTAPAPTPQAEYPYAAQPQPEAVQQTMQMPAEGEDDLPF